MSDPTPIPADVIDAVTADLNRALGVRIVHRDSVADALTNAASALLAAGRTAAAEDIRSVDASVLNGYCAEVAARVAENGADHV